MTRRGFMRRLVTVAVGLPVAGPVIARRVCPVLPLAWRARDYMGDWKWITTDSWAGKAPSGKFPRGMGEVRRLEDKL